MSSLTIPPTRRIVLAHGPLPSASGSIDTEASGSSSSTALEPPVQILHDDDYVEQVWFSSVPADPNPPYVRSYAPSHGRSGSDLAFVHLLPSSQR